MSTTTYMYIIQGEIKIPDTPSYLELPVCTGNFMEKLDIPFVQR